MGKFQAQRISSRSESSIEKYCWSVVLSLYEHKRLGYDIQDALVERFVDSRSYAESARVAGYLSKAKELASGQIDKIVSGATENSQIYSGYVARRFVDDLVRKERKRINKKLLTEYKKTRLASS
jgi:hypothetical protein